MIYVETTGGEVPSLVTQPDYLVTLDDFTFERHWVTKGRRHQLSLHVNQMRCIV